MNATIAPPGTTRTVFYQYGGVVLELFLHAPPQTGDHVQLPLESLEHKTFVVEQVARDYRTPPHATAHVTLRYVR